MMRFAWVTIPCVLLALAACGDGTPDRTPTSGPAPEGLPVPASERRGDDPEQVVDWRAVEPDEEESPASADKDDDPKAEDPGDHWPGIDDDPSFDAPDGSGAWCGTGMRQRPWVGGRLDDLDELWRLGAVWTRYGTSGLMRRFTHEEVSADERRKLEARIQRLFEQMVAAKDQDELRRLAIERAELEVRLARGGERWVQYGIRIEGTLYTSNRGERPSAFLQRAREEAAAKRGGDADPDAAPMRPDPGADAAASGTWSGPDKNGFWRRHAPDPRDDQPVFGPNTFLQYGLERDGVFYMSKPGESVGAFVARVEKDAAAKRERAKERDSKDGDAKQEGR